MPDLPSLPQKRNETQSFIDTIIRLTQKEIQEHLYRYNTISAYQKDISIYQPSPIDLLYDPKQSPM